jgi:transposase
MREQGLFDLARLVFIDETCTNTAMVRLRGRAPRGELLVDYAPHGAWKTVTFVGALRQRGMTAPFVIEGAMNGPMFLAYVRQCLVPTLKRGETVLMDNLPVHKVAGVAEPIQAAGAILIYLPKYSPDLNPIELAFSIKVHLRKAAEHTIPRLLRRVGRVVTDFSAQECRNFFRHAGYVRTRPESALAIRIVVRLKKQLPPFWLLPFWLVPPAIKPFVVARVATIADVRITPTFMMLRRLRSTPRFSELCMTSPHPPFGGQLNSTYHR